MRLSSCRVLHKRCSPFAHESIVPSARQVRFEYQHSQLSVVSAHDRRVVEVTGQCCFARRLREPSTKCRKKDTSQCIVFAGTSRVEKSVSRGKDHLVVWDFGSTTLSFMYPKIARVACDIGTFSNTPQQIEIRNEPTRSDFFLKQVRAAGVS